MKSGLLWSDSFSFILLTQRRKNYNLLFLLALQTSTNGIGKLGPILVCIIDGGAFSTSLWDYSLLYVHL